MNRFFACLSCLLLAITVVPFALGEGQPSGPQTSVGTAPSPKKQALVIIYTLATCPHCSEAKDYFIRNNIPFVNREVDTDSHHMEELMQLYDKMNVPDQKRGVPLIIINDTIRLQGFNKDKFQEALKKAMHN